MKTSLVKTNETLSNEYQEKHWQPCSISNISTNIYKQVSYEKCFQHETFSLLHLNKCFQRLIQDPVKYLKFNFFATLING